MASVRIMVSYDGRWVKSPETGIFRFDGSKAKGMSVPKNTTYQELLDRVHSLLNVDRNEFSVSLNFLYASSVPVAPAEIVNDDDVNFFIDENSGQASQRTPLCVTLVKRGSRGQQIVYGEASSQTINTMPETQEPTSEPVVPLAVIEENEPGFHINNGNEDIETSSEKLGLIDVPIEPQFDVIHLQRTDNIIPVDPITPVGPTKPAAPTAPDSLQARSLQNPSEWVTTKEALTVSLNSSDVSHSEELETRQLFSSKKELQEKLSMLAIKKNFEFKVQKSSKDVLVIACIDDNCQWRLRACKFRDNKSFQIRKFVKDHSCSTESRYNEHRQASSWVIGHFIKSKYEGMNRTYKPKDIIEDVRREFGLNLSYEKAWRAREIALNSDGVPHRRRLTGWSSGKQKRQKEPSGKEDRRIRKCRKCGEVGHYSKTCSVPTMLLLDGISPNGTDDATVEDKVADS